jgi:hypothetical protein
LFTRGQLQSGPVYVFFFTAGESQPVFYYARTQSVVRTVFFKPAVAKRCLLESLVREGT